MALGTFALLFDFGSAQDGETLLVMHELYPSKEALDRAVAGMQGAMPETFELLDELLVTLGASVGQS